MKKIQIATEIDKSNRRNQTYYVWTSWLFGLLATAWMIFLTIFAYLKGHSLLMGVSAHGLSVFLIGLCFFHHKQALHFWEKIDDAYPDVVAEAEKLSTDLHQN